MAAGLRALDLDPELYTASVILWRVYLAQEHYDDALVALASTPFPGIRRLTATVHSGIRGEAERNVALVQQLRLVEARSLPSQ